jgi:hypothetical protein
MQQRERGFFEFFAKYPEAERHEYIHENGKLSTFAVGLFQGVVNEAFLASYADDGKLQSERIFSDDDLATGLEQRSVSPSEALSLLMRLAVDKNGPVSKKN